MPLSTTINKLSFCNDSASNNYMLLHAGDFSAQIWPNRRAQVMRQRLTSNWLFSNETWRTLVECF